VSGEPRAEWRGRADFAEVADMKGLDAYCDVSPTELSELRVAARAGAKVNSSHPNAANAPASLHPAPMRIFHIPTSAVSD